MKLDLLYDSYSVVGTKELTLSEDLPATINFKDSGGIFRNPVERSVILVEKCNQKNFILTNEITGNSFGKMYGSIEFEDGHVTFSSTHPQKIMNCIISSIEAKPDKYNFPLMFFPAKLSISEAVHFLEALSPKSIISKYPFCDLHTSVSDDAKKNSIVPVSITKKGKYLEFMVFNHKPSRIPIDKITVAIEKDTLLFNGKLLLGDFPVNKLCVQFPTEDCTRRLVMQLGIKQTTTKPSEDDPTEADGIMDAVEIYGYLNGKPIEKKGAQSTLSYSKLNIHYKDNSIDFDLSSNSLAIQGTANYFIISSSSENTIVIKPKSNGFLRELASNNYVRSAAYRSANRGPFVAEANNGNIVRIEADGSSAFIPAGSYVNSINRYEKNAAVTLNSNISLSGQLPNLEGIAAALAKNRYTADILNNFQGGISYLLGLEGKYFLYSTLGQIAEMQIALTSALGINNHSPITHATSGENGCQIFLLTMYQNASRLIRFIETTTHYFPAFVMDQDKQFLSKLGLIEKINSRNLEQNYQRALSITSSLANHLIKIDLSLSRLSSLRKNTQIADGWGKYTPLGIQAAASFVNPYMLIGVAQQGISLLNQSDSLNTMEKQTENEVWLSCSTTWDYIIQVLLPAVAYHVSKEIYLNRLAISAILQVAYNEANDERKRQISSNVSSRISRLEAYSFFPENLESTSSRNNAIEFLLESQNQANHGQFRHF